jgi:peptidyl-prolyl cis-trans isomerase A (cyclophilin A)
MTPHRRFRATLAAASLFFSAATLAAQTPPAGQVPKPAPVQMPNQAPAPAQLPDSPGAALQPRVAIVPTGPTVVLDTSAGRLVCKLFDKQAPLASANFIGLAEGAKDYTDPVTGEKVHGKRFYDGTTFHRVIPSFMIQGGDPRGDGTGDGGYYFESEIVSGLDFDVAGRLAMANSGPNTNGTQFFITEAPEPDLDGKYTIFGQCDAHSVLIVATIARVDRNRNDKPTTPVYLNKVTVVREGEPMPPEPAPPAAAASPVPAPQ